jgi:hypothetical protein
MKLNQAGGGAIRFVFEILRSYLSTNNEKTTRNYFFINMSTVYR